MEVNTGKSKRELKEDNQYENVDQTSISPSKFSGKVNDNEISCDNFWKAFILEIILAVLIILEKSK